MKLGFLGLLALLSFACAPPGRTAPPMTSAVAPRPVYRLDFVLTSTDNGSSPSSAAFTLNLEEHDKGEVLVGQNVPLVPGGGARQDVGTKVTATFRPVDQNILVDVLLELSTLDAPTTIRKVVVKGDVFAAPGHAAVVAMLDHDGKHQELSVTPTKIR